MAKVQHTAGEWVATEWAQAGDLASFNLGGVTIRRMHSPFYEGIRYAVRRGSACLATDGEWEFEPSPSSRDDAFYARCRFASFDDAAAALARAEGR